MKYVIDILSTLLDYPFYLANKTGFDSIVCPGQQRHKALS